MICWSLLLPGIHVAAFAGNEDVNLTTKYEKGTFETEAYIETEASMEVLSGIVSDVNIYLRRLEIDSLKWATKGLSGKEDGKNLIRIDYKDGEFDQNTEIFNFFIEIYVGILKKQFKNIQVAVLMKSENDSNNYPSIIAELYDSNFFLKNAKGTLTIRQTGNKNQFVIRSSVRFGWFFNIFISTSNYCAVAEWRIQTLLENLKAEAERRQHDLQKE